MKIVSIMTLLASLLLYLQACNNNSYLEREGGVMIMHLEGSPYERGIAHGRLLNDEIHETVAAWQLEVVNTFQCDFNTVIAEFFSETAYRISIQKNDPDLLDEVFGMSEATGINFNTLLAFQMSEELFSVLEREAHMNCTAIGVARSDSTPTILAQNMDPPDFLHGNPLVMHIRPANKDPERYIFTVPGLLGLAGMNEQGIAITCTGMSMLNHSTAGMPVISLVRSVLCETDLQETCDLIEHTSFAIPQCFTLGGPDGIRCFECSANQVEEFYPFEDHRISLHTNHSIKNRDFNSGFVELLKGYGKTIDDPYFCPRYFHAYDEIEACNRSLDVERIKGILRLKEPELEQILNQHTLGTLVMELDSSPVLYLALGQQEDDPFHTLQFH